MIKNLSKLVVAGATVVAIGSVMIALEPDRQVKPAEADILALDFAPTSKSEKFVGSLKDLGMEKPRVYDWNGNKMFFSTMETSRTPTQVLADFQREFVEEGVNQHAYTRAVEPAAEFDAPETWKDLPPEKREEASKVWADYYHRSADYFGGGMVPTMITPGYVAMGGMESKQGAKNGLEFLKEIKHKGSERLTDNVGVARYIEAFQSGGKTRVTATWTQDDVDFNKFRNVGDDIGSTDKIPSCVGCNRLMRFVSESEKGYATNVYEATQSVDQVVAFYERALADRGWRIAPAVEAMRNAEKQGWKEDDNVELISFARDGEFITLLVHPDGTGRTSVQVIESP